MKKIIIALAVLAIVIAGGVIIKMNFPTLIGEPANSVSQTAPQIGGGFPALPYSKAEPMVLPPVGSYQLATVDLGDGPVPLLTIPLDTWGGYAALFQANGGIEPNKNSLFYQRGHFGVKLVREESAQAQLNGYASGKWPIIWAQMDSLPILFDAFRADKRVVPKVLGLFDFSSGGDGIIAKSSVRSPADLRGKTILTSSNSPYAFLMLWYLAQNGLTGNDVKVVWVDDGDKALQLFKSSNEIVAWVTWTPFLNDVLNQKSPSYVPGTRLLINSRDANQLIADVYVIRNDLLQDQPQLGVLFNQIMFEASQQIGPLTYQTMANFYGVSNSDAQAMLQDVHITNFPENKKFFDPNNDVGASKIFALAEEYYKQLGSIPSTSNYDVNSVLTPKVLAQIDQSGQFANQKIAKAVTFDTSDLSNSRVVLTNNVQLFFAPGETTFDPQSASADIVKNMKRLAGVEEQTKFLSTTIVKLTGYVYENPAYFADLKAKGPGPTMDAKTQDKIFSKKRAEWIKAVLINVYGTDPERIITEGGGWDDPLNDQNPNANRRVEVNFLSSE